jgi:hypothetical protein
MKSFKDLQLNTCCAYRKFLSKPDLLHRFFEINQNINISTEPVEDLIDRHSIDPGLIANNTIYCSSIATSVNFNLVIFPLFWMYSRPLVDFDINNSKKKKFITINGAYSTIRNEFISRLNTTNLINDGYFSLWNYNGNSICLPSEKHATHHFSVKHVLPIEWHNSLYEFEIETSSSSGIPYLFISEKTFRPLLSGKPFLNYGYPGMYQKLKDYGFTFDFDLEFDNDVYNRFDLYFAEVVRLINEPFIPYELIKQNKKIARDLYNDNLVEFNNFKKQIDELSQVTYLDDKMMEYIDVNNGNG